jgi:DNA-binding NarL/FixJ family response regulator
MLNEESFKALGHIYDAAIHPGKWRRALDATVTATGGKAAAMIIRSDGVESRDLTLMNSDYLKFSRSAWGVYYGLRLRHLQEPDWMYLSDQPQHRLIPDTDIGIPKERLDARRDYAMLRKRVGISRRLGVRLNSDRIWLDALSLSFDTATPQVPPSAQATIQPLLPHLSKAVEIGRTFAKLRQRYKAALAALDRVRVGLAIALPTGEIIARNSEFDRITEAGDGVRTRSDGRLSTRDGAQDAQIAAHIAEAAGTARGEAQVPERLMSLARPSDQTPFLLDIAPLSDPNAEIETDLSGALLTLIDPDHVPYLRLSRFAMLYKLTNAETEVLEWIVKGATVAEIAERRSTSPVTAKNQIKAILDKSGVGRRTELIRLIIRVLPPVG